MQYNITYTDLITDNCLIKPKNADILYCMAQNLKEENFNKSGL